jgi:hypothetical protein
VQVGAFSSHTTSLFFMQPPVNGLTHVPLLAPAPTGLHVWPSLHGFFGSQDSSLSLEQPTKAIDAKNKNIHFNCITVSFFCHANADLAGWANVRIYQSAKRQKGLKQMVLNVVPYCGAAYNGKPACQGKRNAFFSGCRMVAQV